jgi:hypothetical protein
MAAKKQRAEKKAKSSLKRWSPVNTPFISINSFMECTVYIYSIGKYYKKMGKNIKNGFFLDPKSFNG